MAKKQRAGNSDKTQYKSYQSGMHWKKNKERKLIARLLKNENDNGARIALENLANGKTTYSRNKFKNKGWFHPQESKLLKETQSEVKSIASAAREKLVKLRDIKADKRPSAVRAYKSTVTTPEQPLLIVDQLYNIGLINEKRRNIVKSRMGGLRRR